MYNNYLRELGAHLCEIVEVKKSEWKGVQSLVVTFERDDGARIDAKLKLPMIDFNKKKLARWLQVLGAKQATDLRGKECAILVAPSEYNGKLYWNVVDLFDKKYLASLDEQLADDLGGAPMPTDDDNLGF